MRALTARQAAVLRWIYRYGVEHGYAPNLREIGAGLGMASTFGVNCHLQALERKGALTRTKHIARSIVLSPEAVAFASKAAV